MIIVGAIATRLVFHEQNRKRFHRKLMTSSIIGDPRFKFIACQEINKMVVLDFIKHWDLKDA